jgi:hypothetical protein
MALKVSLCFKSVQEAAQKKILKPRVQTALESVAEDQRKKLLELFHSTLLKV